MALYDGFFDTVLDEETGSYDREYDSSDFTGYFGEIIGSGVCVYEDPNSFLVRLENGTLQVSPGYLFIQGYWLRNTEDYPLDLPASGVYAVLAHLNLGSRIVELLVEEKAESYPDSLVLAELIVGYDGAASLEDTRRNDALCGIIDSIGSLSGKVEFAINYIDSEVDKRLDEAEASVAAQNARLDAKIAEVAALAEALAPPPVGAVKFSASKHVGPEWLRCDGSYISQDDYPDLVEALGKLTPSASAFWEGYKGAVGSGLSNGYLYEGTYYVFSVTDKKLYGYTGTSKRLQTITVTGAEKLTSSPANPVCLSIVKGHLFLAQNQISANACVLLEASNFTGSGNVSLTERDIKPAILAYGATMVKIPGENFVPEVASIRHNWGTGAAPDVQDSFVMCLGRRNAYVTGSQYSWNIYALVWKEGDFSSAKVFTGFSSNSSNNGNDTYAGYVNTLFRYSRKTASELLVIDATTAGAAVSMSLFSRPNGTFDSTNTGAVQSASLNDPIRTSPVAGNGRYIYRCFISGKKLNVRAGKYNPGEPYPPQTAAVAGMSLPSRASVFPDSVCYAANQDLWFIFVGTGIAFSQTPEVGTSWGYLDTQDTLGVITQFGCLDYDPDKNLLYISGQDTTNKGKLGVMQVPELYNYANDGAWLPSIASHGVPAYIKAYEPEGAT